MGALAGDDVELTRLLVHFTTQTDRCIELVGEASRERFHQRAPTTQQFEFDELLDELPKTTVEIRRELERLVKKP